MTSVGFGRYTPMISQFARIPGGELIRAPLPGISTPDQAGKAGPAFVLTPTMFGNPGRKETKYDVDVHEVPFRELPPGANAYKGTIRFVVPSAKWDQPDEWYVEQTYGRYDTFSNDPDENERVTMDAATALLEALKEKKLHERRGYTSPHSWDA